jgi:hypothetical protein
LFVTAAGRSHTAGRHGAELIESFPRAFEPPPGVTGLQRLRMEYEHKLVVGYVGALMAPWTRRRFDLPSAFPWVALLAARTPFVVASEIARRVVPGADALVTRNARSRAERWYRERSGGKAAEYDPGAALRR